jgi:hypothetical protein
MAELFTPTYGFVKPQPGTGEPQDVAKINSNMDLVDKYAHVIWVNDGVTPATGDLIEGATVGEITSGKMWVAKKNIGGTFDKKWVRFPWSAVATTTGQAVASSVWEHHGFLSWGGASIGVAGGGPVNADASALSATALVVPITGIYSGFIAAEWVSNNAGVRGVRVNFNNSTVGQDINTTDIRTSVPSATTTHKASFQELLPAGTTIAGDFFQNCGSTLGVSYVIFATLITPVN